MAVTRIFGTIFIIEVLLGKWRVLYAPYENVSICVSATTVQKWTEGVLI